MLHRYNSHMVKHEIDLLDWMVISLSLFMILVEFLLKILYKYFCISSLQYFVY